MITLRQIKLENFLSHKDSSLTFSNEEKLLIDGNSGSGKSAIVDAIIWCLYGKGRVENRFLVTRGEKKCSVELTLDSDGDEYKIVRSATAKGGHSIEVFDPDGHIDRAGVRDIQDWIENEFLHSSYLLFINSIAYVQDNSDTFVKQTAAKRKELLLEIVRANQYSELYKKASDRLTIELGEKIILSSKISSIEERSNSIRSTVLKLTDHILREHQLDLDLAEVQLKIKDLEKRKNDFYKTSEKIDYLKNHIDLVKASLEKSMRRIREITTTISSVDKEKKDLERLELEYESIGDVSEKVNELSVKIGSERDRIMKLNFTISNRINVINYAEKIVEIDKQIDSLEKDSGQCPSGDLCPLGAPMRLQIEFLRDEKKRRQDLAMEQSKKILEQEKEEKQLSTPLVTNEEMEQYSAYNELAKKRSEIGERIKIGKAKIGSVDSNALKDELDQISSEQVKLQSRLDSSQLELDKMLADSVGYSMVMIDKDLRDLNAKEIVIASDLRTVQSLISIATNAKSELAKNEEEVSEMKKKQQPLEENIIALTSLKEAFSPKGIPAVVIDYIVPKLEESINEILCQLSDFRIRIDTQRKNSTGDGIVEGLFLTICNESGEEFDYDAYSGGQKLKITVAISEALASLQKVGFRIMDETFTALDEESTDEFVDVMEKLQSKFKQILCITHLKNVKDLFQDKITVTRINGLSIIK